MFVSNYGLATMDLFFYLLYLYLVLVLHFEFCLSLFGLLIVGLDLVSFTVLVSELAAVGLDLISFSSFLKSKLINLYSFEALFFVLSYGLAKLAWTNLNNTVHFVYIIQLYVLYLRKFKTGMNCAPH